MPSRGCKDGGAVRSTSGSPLEWAARWREIVRDPGLYQDRFIVLGSGPYSGTAAADVGLGEAEWTRSSIAIRLEHECTHHFTRRVLGSMRNRLADELIADYMGIVGGDGAFPGGLARPLPRAGAASGLSSRWASR